VTKELKKRAVRPSSLCPSGRERIVASAKILSRRILRILQAEV
jgi:hypothetical protein